MKKLRLLPWSLTIAVLLVVDRAAFAQSATSGSINGGVTDHTGAVLPGVTVTATSPAEMTIVPAITNEKGQYRFPSLAPGVYRLAFELQGFATLVREGIEVHVDFTATVNVQLGLGKVSEMVHVRAETPLVDVESTTFTDIVEADVLELRPNSRDVYAIISAIPGVRMSSFDIGGANIGNPTDFVVYGFNGNDRIQIQGVNRSEGTGGSPGYMDYGAFQQVTIGTAANDASAPNPGIVFNAVLKSGGDRFSGTEFFAYQHKDLQSENNTDRLRNLGIGSGTKILKMYDPNFDLGGPIKRKRLWFFGSTRFQTVATKFSTFPLENPGAGPANQRELMHATTKLTLQTRPGGKIEQFIEIDRKHQPYRDASGNGTADSAQDQSSPGWTAGLTWSNVHARNMLTEITLGTWGYNWHRQARGVNGVVGEDIRQRRFEDTTDHFSGGISESRQKRLRVQVGGKATKYLDGWLGANHTLTLGQLSEWEALDVSTFGFKDAFQMIYLTPSGLPDWTTPDRITIYNTPYEEVNAVRHHSLYLQDRIRVNRRVTINAGVRYDHYSEYYPDQEIGPGPFRDFFYSGAPINGFSLPPSRFSDFKVPGTHVFAYGALAPRIGISYGLDRRNRSVLKANWGRFYFNRGTSEAGLLNPAGSQSATFRWIDLDGDSMFQPGEFGDLISTSASAVNTRLAPDLPVPHMDDASLWFEQQIGRDIAGRVGVIARWTEDQWADVNLTRTRDLWTRQRPGVDPGIDGIVGTEDDGGPFVYWDYPTTAELPTLPLSSFERRAIPTNDDFRRSLDMRLTKRPGDKWYAQLSYVSTWDTNLSSGFPQTPNQDIHNKWTQRIWQFKLDATYFGPRGVTISPSLRMQNGSNMARTINVSGRTGTIGFRLEPFGRYREETTTVWDLAVFKTFRVGAGRNVRVSVDAYNIFNSNVVLTRDSVTGRTTVTNPVTRERLNIQRFYRPTAIMPPRVVRFAMRYSFGGSSNANRGSSRGRQDNAAAEPKDAAR